MNTMTNEIPMATSAALEKLKLALQSQVASGTARRTADFKEAYPLIEQHLAGGGSQRAACDQFNAAYGYKLHQPKFRNLLNAERKWRAERGDEAECDKCGSVLHSVADDALSVNNMEGE